ncbi:trimeric intracellular cation channel family protein [uncultured Arcticibacterium sp.]|uniref:trimeric intracellular cation channel family protein n=1 Tax=uncultured Arcticibacterium sp. TaxID=2173042 RepID=UPI0030FB22F6
MTWIYFLDLFGTCVFAISGVLMAIEKRFDLVGTLIIGFVTAVGGGTLRDLLIGRSPVGWLNDRNYMLAILIGYVIAYVFYKRVLRLKKGMFLFDTLGIGVFTIIGVKIAAEYNLRVETCIMMGVISACFGGVIRDVLTNEIPLIFRKEIYAAACLLGAVIYIIMQQFCPIENVNVMVSMAIVFIVRYLSFKNGWTLNLKKFDDLNGFGSGDK